MTDAPTPARLEELLARATPGPWHHCQAFMTVSAARTVHGPVPSVRVDYVSTWPHAGGTPKGHRVVIPMEGREANVRSEDMALAALSPTLAARVIELEAQNAKLTGALQSIAAHGSHHGGYCGCHQATFINIVRTALEAKP